MVKNEMYPSYLPVTVERAIYCLFYHDIPALSTWYCRVRHFSPFSSRHPSASISPPTNPNPSHTRSMHQQHHHGRPSSSLGALAQIYFRKAMKNTKWRSLNSSMSIWCPMEESPLFVNRQTFWIQFAFKHEKSFDFNQMYNPQIFKVKEQHVINKIIVYN